MDTIIAFLIGLFSWGADDAAAASRFQLSAGLIHTCSSFDGAARCWGSNPFGQLGDGTSSERSSPVGVLGLAGGVTQITAGDSHTCALTDDGNAWCWGSNSYGQLGDGTNRLRSSPVSVAGIDSKVVQISAGTDHSCAVTQLGEVWCWGDNISGQIGNGENGFDLRLHGISKTNFTPVRVSGINAKIVQVAAGQNHTCALTEGGGVICWGANSHGQLGDGTSTARMAPVLLRDLRSGVSDISAGNGHTCAVQNGAAKCWGANIYGQLGDGSTSGQLTPVQVAGLDDGVSAIYAGMTFRTCAIHHGSAKCWGENRSGMLGDLGDVQATAVQLADFDKGVSAIAIGYSHICARRESRTLCAEPD